MKIFLNVKRPSAELLNRFVDVPTPFVSDNMDRLWGASVDLKPFHGTAKLVGPAFTVKVRPGDNLMVHKALELVLPGDVIVVDAGGDTTNAIFGEIMMTIAIKKKVAGIVINGSIRDVKAFRDSGFPIYAKGITHLGPYKDGPGEINVPVNISGMLVHPGDIIIGDEDGLVAIPLDEAPSLLKKIEIQARNEERTIREIKDGTIDRSWIDELLDEKGCQYID